MRPRPRKRLMVFRGSWPSRVPLPSPSFLLSASGLRPHPFSSRSFERSFSKVEREHLVNTRVVGFAGRGVSVEHQRRIQPVEIVYRSHRTSGSSDRPTSRQAVRAKSAVPVVDTRRLSQDVIREIEKQIRIERERRGRI